MSIDSKEIKRVTLLQEGKKCKYCKVGTYYKLKNDCLLCLNCGKNLIVNIKK